MNSKKADPKIYPVLLSGGSGMRLWPLSRSSYPKQFANLIGDTSLFQKTALRLKTSSELTFETPLTITNSKFRFTIGYQLSQVGFDRSDIIIEPEGKNTAAAILAASIAVAQRDPNALLLVSPTDHMLEDISLFHKTLKKGIDSALSGDIVTFGITPTRPETGFGYLELARPSNDEAVLLKSFVEKPDRAKADKMIKSDNYLWNAGLFLFQAKNMIAAFKALKPTLLKQVQQAFDNSLKDLDFLRLDADAWSACEDISIDYAIMEHITNRSVVPLRCGWSDLGEWEAVWRESQPDQKGVATSANVTAIDCQNVLLRSESETQHLVGLGLENMIAIAMEDAVLVADKNRSQDVKQVVEILRNQKVAQAETFPIDHRPWGWFKILTLSGEFQVKRIFIKPGAALSLQSHKHRSEHWVVISGMATVTINDEVTKLKTGQSTFIPKGALHRLENKEKEGLEIIEIQLGHYLGEDDITRYDDIYARHSSE